ncbi:unnamed protein product [Owenia fusiformis]|uniref:Uncharacterized protein n=1 Tax=Owenia fusiformis TaxID=6347 RepID=A0A8J1UVD7_OWEFU|nr:unnamed protein product [Owenia fusiformis]
MKPFSREVDSTMSSSIQFHHRKVRSSWPTLLSIYLIYLILSCVVGVSAQTPSTSQCTTTVDGAERITNCSSLGLSSVPVDLDPLTTELYLDYNNINTIRDNSFSYLQQLKTLSARSNGMVTIEQRGLAGLTELDVLDLSDNELVSISAEALDNCNPDHVTIDGNRFTEETLRQFSSTLAGKRLSKLSVKGNPTFVNITQDTFKPIFNLQFLDISGCDIKSLPKSAFDGFRRLKELHIENNTNLAHIDNDAFLNMQQLETLSLAGCALERVTNFLKDKAVDLQSLYNMDLSRNLISTIDAYSFYPMKSIRHLDLSRNKIERITIYFEFVGLTGLKYLNLSRNPLFSIAGNSFRGMSDIETLDLSDCQFSSLRGQELYGLYTLSILYLNNNPLTLLSDTVFKNQSSMSEVHLTNCRLTELTASFKGHDFIKIVADNNRIRNIAPDAFDGCTRLNEIQVQGNNLQTIPDALCSNPNIQKVDISNNKFNSIDSKTTDCLRKWSFFDGSKNPYTCDGRLVDFTVFANDTGRSVVQQWPDGYRCNTPIEWQNQTVHHYINTQWLTTTTTTTTTTVAPTTEKVTTVPTTIATTVTTNTIATTSPFITTTLPLTPTTNKLENISEPFESRQISDRDMVIICLSTLLGVAFIIFLIVLLYVVIFNGPRRNKSWTVRSDMDNSHKQSYNKFEMTNIEIRIQIVGRQ